MIITISTGLKTTHQLAKLIQIIQEMLHGLTLWQDRGGISVNSVQFHDSVGENSLSTQNDELQTFIIHYYTLVSIKDTYKIAI